jgi:hypothetical protein
LHSFAQVAQRYRRIEGLHLSMFMSRLKARQTHHILEEGMQ